MTTDVVIEKKEAKAVKEDSAGKAKKLGSAYAAWVQTPIGATPVYNESILVTSLGGDNADKLGGLAKLKFHDRLKLIRAFFEIDPIANTVVEKNIDIGIGRLIFDRDDCDDREVAIYQKAEDLFTKYLREAALEYLLSGLVIPQVTWGKVPPSEIGNNARKIADLPERCWILNPENITLKSRIFQGDVAAYFTVPEELRRLILSEGDGDPEGYRTLVEQFPDLVKRVKAGEMEILLEDAFIIRRKPKTYDPYPSSYLLPALEALEYKRNLRKMDYSIAARIIGAIQLIKLGNDTFPLTEDDEDQITDLKSELLWRGKANNVERVFQLFGNHTLEIEWIYPDTEAMLSQEKYTAVNQDIFFALGFPRILVSGETLKSATSSAEYAMFSPAESIKRMREDILTWVDELLNEIQKRNNLKNRVNVRFEEIRLYDMEKIADIASVLYDNNALSLTSLAQSAGYDFDKEIVMKSRERDLMEEYDIPEFPSKPFSPQPETVAKPATKPPAKKPVAKEKTNAR